VVGLVIAVGLAVHVRAWSFLCDDAYISFRYARNLSRHGALEYNLGERVEGYTNFGWVVLLAGLDALGVPPESAATVLDAAFAAATVAAAVWLCRGLRGLGRDDLGPARIELVDLVPAALLAATPEFAVWGSSGLETSAVAAAAVGAMGMLVHGRWISAAGLAATAVLLRPDAMLPLGVFGLAWLLIVGVPHVASDAAALGRVRWTRVAIAAGVFVVPVAAHLLWRRGYYGQWVPNTWTIKAHGVLLRDTYGIGYVERWVQALHLHVLVPLIVMIRPRHLVLLAPSAAVVVYGWSVGGDFMAYSRFYVVATTAVAVLVGWILADIAHALRRRVRPAVAYAMSAALGLGLAGGLAREARQIHARDRSTGAKWLEGKWEGVTAMHRFAAVGLAAGSWMHRHLPPDTWLAVGAAGALPYAAELPAVDVFGLTAPGVSTMSIAPVGGGGRPGHQIVAPVSYVLGRDVDLLCNAGFRGTRRPKPNETLPAFRRGYRWACIDLGRIEDRTDPTGFMAPQFYCCRRPQGRTVGPFGTPEEP
jgi:arabinofuranosyltransferase